jgi:FkbM family methyltransferase
MIPDYTTEYALHEFKLHGEYQLMEKMKYISMKTIFDVGCNVGEWSRMTRSFQSLANIHMFELVPRVYQQMIRNHVIDDNMYPNSFGLSNETKDVVIKEVLDNTRVSTMVLNLRHDNSVLKKAVVVHPETYTQYHDIDYIDYLKIDTEGHEYFVLDGFKNMIEQGKIGCIQFEYGYACILTRKLLIDFYQLLTPYDYILGKLTPEGVQFKDYILPDEDFQGPDYIAVHKSRRDIIELAK